MVFSLFPSKLESKLYKNGDKWYLASFSSLELFLSFWNIILFLIVEVAFKLHQWLKIKDCFHKNPFLALTNQLFPLRLCFHWLDESNVKIFKTSEKNLVLVVGWSQLGMAVDRRESDVESNDIPLFVALGSVMFTITLVKLCAFFWSPRVAKLVISTRRL